MNSSYTLVTFGTPIKLSYHGLCRREVRKYDDGRMIECVVNTAGHFIYLTPQICELFGMEK